MTCSPEVNLVAFGRWFRLCLGSSGKPDPILRRSRFHGHRMLALRLWTHRDGVFPGWRIVVFQTRRRKAYDKRLRFKS